MALPTYGEEVAPGSLYKTPPYERTVDYLRIAVTDRCNLRCIYCMPPEGVPRLPHKDILSYEELLRFASIARSFGISKIRITGGEPLLRKGIISFINRLIKEVTPEEVTITTNGVLLADCAEELFKAGVRRVNISLDTLRADRFKEITRSDSLKEVFRGIDKAMAIGFHPVKLNVVVMKGINDDEVEDLARLTLKESIHVRFIEFMPFGGEEWEKRFIPSREIIDRLKEVGELESTVSLNNNGPAKYMRFKKGIGKIGIISPMSQHFCNSCNRLRLTPEGKLRTCLFSPEETDIRQLLRCSASDGEIAKVLIEVLKRKPSQRILGTELIKKCISRPMSKIGG
ncbi:MAG: GTP 3',8-cyclase MoaA [Syntrophobacterales bacterium]|nr:GTP 3',8-cyclase MoaA [Syntrophobacterales bacterium]